MKFNLYNIVFTVVHDALQPFFQFQLSPRVNSFDDRNQLPLDIALSSQQEALAKTLLEHKANVDQADSVDDTLLHKAVRRGKNK
jgi:ankyrin repeat protein